jgi:hypothetical protein
MTTYVGEKVTIRVEASDPILGQAITDGQLSVEFYAPGKDPKNLPDDRVKDQGPYDMTWSDEAQAYFVQVSTAGWVAGKWTYKVTLTGGYDSWEYATLTLKL